MFSIPVFPEYIFLKSGEIKEGSIISDSAASITLRGKDKITITINRSDILRTLYTELYMGKIYVQKIDGKNEICYMVNEDRDTYTFRKELYSPEEFNLKRTEVLFMARGNPSGLNGEPETDEINLKWYPPYNPVKKYRIYLKKQNDTAYSVADECRWTGYKLKNLKSNTKYIIYVTALDEAGDESLPSNELKITTLNIKPDRPLNLRYEKRNVPVIESKTSKKIKSYAARKYVLWDPAKDVDGVIKGYNVYHYKDGKEEKINTVAVNEFELPEEKSVYDLRITAFDDLNEESPMSRIRHPRAFKIGIQPVYLIPQEKLADMFQPGYGGLGTMSFKNFFKQNLEWGISGGVIKLPGKDPDKIGSMLLAPVTLDAGYHFVITEWFSAMPYFSIGCTYMDIKYSSLYQKMSKTDYALSLIIFIFL
jgi:hypothetical protein